jgi:hypothetical protein
MDGEITIVSASPYSNQTKNQEYRVLSHHPASNKIQSVSYRIDELLKFVNELKPEIITIFTADMHGRTIVAFLEYFLSRKFKLVLYELSSGHRGMLQSRIIIIKMQKYV